MTSFIGDWDTFDIDHPTQSVARKRVDRIFEGWVLREDYQGNDGAHGESFTIYDPSRKLWHQSWVTNRGALLVIEGGMRDGEIVLSGVDHTADGKEGNIRGTWKQVTGGVRETAVRSIDGGKTWNPWFDLMSRPSARSETAADAPLDVKKTIAVLDTQYQLAVKNNDALTMDRLWADDFFLVTSSGKAFSKADLLNEARRGHYVCDHQEDTDQTVRVWGNSAVVTARL